MAKVALQNSGAKSVAKSKKSLGRRKFWTLKLKGKVTVPKRSQVEQEGEIDENSCVCKKFNRAPGGDFSCCADTPASEQAGGSKTRKSRNKASRNFPREVFVALTPVNFDELYPTEDIDSLRIAKRKQEMEQGIEVQLGGATGSFTIGGANGGVSPELSEEEEDYTSLLNRTQDADSDDELYGECPFPIIPCNIPRNRFMPQVHSSVEYIHCLVPDTLQITKCSFYWGVMDRYQAEKLLDKKPEGTFLLRDSAQDDYLFSVSFRRYGRSLHARIEQWNHKFSFDSHDPGVFASDTVCGLIEHYKDPSCCMFFEPMLTLPLHRNFPFSLQHLCRARISQHVTYDSISLLPLPKTLREYMRYYHYKQKVRLWRHDLVWMLDFDANSNTCTCTNLPRLLETCATLYIQVQYSNFNASPELFLNMYHSVM